MKVEGAAGIGGNATVRTWQDDGRFDSGVVAGDVLRLTVTAEGYAPRVLGGLAPDSELDVVLQRAAR